MTMLIAYTPNKRVGIHRPHWAYGEYKEMLEAAKGMQKAGCKVFLQDAYKGSGAFLESID